MLVQTYSELQKIPSVLNFMTMSSIKIVKRQGGQGPSLSDICFKRQGDKAPPCLTPALRAMQFDT